MNKLNEVPSASARFYSHLRPHLQSLQRHDAHCYASPCFRQHRPHREHHRHASTAGTLRKSNVLFWSPTFDPALKDTVGQDNMTPSFFTHLCARRVELQQPHLVFQLRRKYSRSFSSTSWVFPFTWICTSSTYTFVHYLISCNTAIVLDTTSSIAYHNKVTLLFEPNKMPVTVTKRVCHTTLKHHSSRHMVSKSPPSYGFTSPPSLAWSFVTKHRQSNINLYGCNIPQSSLNAIQHLLLLPAHTWSRTCCTRR